MLSKNEKEKLVFENTNFFEVFISELFEMCDTEECVEWLIEQLTKTIGLVADERLVDFAEGF